MIIIIGALAVISSLVLYCCIRVGSLSDAKIEEFITERKRKKNVIKGVKRMGKSGIVTEDYRIKENEAYHDVAALFRIYRAVNWRMQIKINQVKHQFWGWSMERMWMLSWIRCTRQVWISTRIWRI